MKKVSKTAVLGEAECFVGKKVTMTPAEEKQIILCVKGQQRVFVYGG
jgi:hypothetical protein